MEINERIFYLLKTKYKTAKELGDYIGVATSSISAWKNSGSFPSSKYIIRISEFFNVSIEYLFTGKDIMRSEDAKSSFSTPLSLSDNELELLEIYRKLDNRGKHKVHTVTYDELDRLEGNSSHQLKENIG